MTLLTFLPLVHTEVVTQTIGDEHQGVVAINGVHASPTLLSCLCFR
jgi:hypothetical protein